MTLDYDGEPVDVTFGFREISISGSDILLNGEPIHLRGTVESCCFPETGFPPCDTASWERIFRICKSYGLNHMRFHSYCPPEAAFVAADRLGFYLQPEGPSWPNHGVKLGNGMPIDKYLKMSAAPSWTLRRPSLFRHDGCRQRAGRTLGGVGR